MMVPLPTGRRRRRRTRTQRVEKGLRALERRDRRHGRGFSRSIGLGGSSRNARRRRGGTRGSGGARRSGRRSRRGSRDELELPKLRSEVIEKDVDIMVGCGEIGMECWRSGGVGIGAQVQQKDRTGLGEVKLATETEGPAELITAG